ncbi:hypothetical protein [Orenia marismortui]|uniref:hypothetical protein n=1 Tax=Orenia marismortui TaxID=46469 RepID=UPI00037BF499|nr:hypothetical protein [Orenia marismortui]
MRDNKLKNLISFNNEFNIQLLIHSGVIEYIGGFDPDEMWEARGLAGHKGEEFQATMERWSQLGKEKLKNDSKFQRELAIFINEVLELFNAIINKQDDIVNKYIGRKEFHFIIGMNRTGGTYLQSEVSRAFDWPMQKMIKSLVHDGIPYPMFIKGDKHNRVYVESNLAWRRPENYYNFIFQLSQFLVYINQVAKDKKKVVLKNVRFSHSISLLDRIFGDSANYLITVRHPAAIGFSLFENTLKSSYNDVTIDDAPMALVNYLIKWKNTYTEILRDGLPKGEITPILFSEMDMFLVDFFKKHGFDSEPSGLRITPRNYDYDCWDGKEVNDIMNQIEKLWSFYGLDFPVPKQIL